MTYDVAVIGGGLAGLATSIQVAKEGKSVILFERNTYPFHRVCGEYVSMESWKFLNRLGLELGQEDLPFITKLHISSPSGRIIKHKLNPGGFGVSRYKLDNMLAYKAEKCGVDLHAGIMVAEVKCLDNIWKLVDSSGGTYSAKTAIGSFGKRSNIDLKLHRGHIIKNKSQNLDSNFIAVKYHVDSELPSDLIELHNFDNGYCGISKVENNLSCLCYLTTAKNLQRCNNNIQELEKTILSQNPILKDYLNRFNKLYDKPLSIAQIDFSDKEIVEQGMLMVGDAAGLITPLCGNGMSMALKGSYILAPMLLDHLEGNLSFDQLHNQYQLRWKSEFKNRLKAGRIFQSLFGNTVITEAVITLLKMSPTMMKKLVRLTHGESF